MRQQAELCNPQCYHLLNGVLTRSWDGLQQCFPAAKFQAALEYPFPSLRAHLKEQAVASRCQHEKVLGFPKAPLIQGLLWHAEIFLNVLQLWLHLLGFIRTLLVSIAVGDSALVEP